MAVRGSLFFTEAVLRGTLVCLQMLEHCLLFPPSGRQRAGETALGTKHSKVRLVEGKPDSRNGAGRTHRLSVAFLA